MKVSTLPSETNPSLSDSTINNTGNTSTKRTTWQKIFDLFQANGMGSSSPTITNDVTTNATMYPTWVTANSGALPLKVSDSKTTVNPSTAQYTFGTNATTINVCDINGENCSTVDVTENHIKNQNEVSRWHFGNNSTGTSARTAVFLSGDLSHGEYGAFQIIPTTNTQSQLKPGIFFICSGSGCTAGIDIFADNGVIALGTVNNLTNGANGLVVGANPNQYIGIGTRTPSYEIHLQKSENGDVEIMKENTSTGTSARVIDYLKNNNGDVFTRTITGSNYTTNGLIVARQGYEFNTGTSRLAVNSVAASPFIWAIGGFASTNEVARLTGSGLSLGVAGTTQGKVILNGSTSGSLTITSPAASGSNTLTLPAGTTDFSATGGTSQVVKQTSAGAALTVGQLASTDISDYVAPTNYSDLSTIVGWTAFDTKEITYMKVGKLLTVWFHLSDSNDATGSTVTFTIPYTALNNGVATNFRGCYGSAINNGGGEVNANWVVTANTNVVTLYATGAYGGFSNANGTARTVRGMIQLPVQ